jgi:hypothetical protein
MRLACPARAKDPAGRREAAAVMSRSTVMEIGLGVLATVAACNPERKQDCEKFLAVMMPANGAMPNAGAVDEVNKNVAALGLRDQPLRIYATNYQSTLTVLSNTLRLKDDPSAPDGTDSVMKTHLKEARTAREDVERYCAQ